MYIILAYDIPDNARRNRLAKTLDDFGQRVQESVFEFLIDEKRYDTMLNRIMKLIDTDMDKVRIYRLCSSCLKNVKVLGKGELLKDVDVYIV